MKQDSLKYTFKTYRLDHLYLPAAFLALFMIICMFRLEPDDLFDMSRAYLGAVIPLVGGIMASYAILDDPALELRFGTPARAEHLLVERLGLIFLIQVMCATIFQVFVTTIGADLSPLGSFWRIQLAWFIPTISLMSLGCLGSLISAQTMTGTFLTSLIWLIELLARGWLACNSGKYFLVFMGALMADHPDLTANQITLTVLTFLFLIFSWLLLRKQEQYI
ncbi:hypothetical protein [Leptolinea tardivitalis]|uniref:ABC-2 type transporter domain-containing protein n=1 Tax=Leptolinea tardivitalis TaxID=229920 RepID=A0A0P6XPX9_9CHLR|nr:hypothetical protein [Leptolinea tardivitalis]KPL71335.1 hypothetical protein ADM99_11595 [Leptolinea tardivitalis]GAP23113.1 hypothetical protein LTAR_03358 [Leptolinea tardivitalis]